MSTSMMQKSLIAAAALALVAGCVTESPTNLELEPGDGSGGTGNSGNGGGATGGEGTGNTGTGGTGTSGSAKAFFISDVYPAIATDCGECHATGDFGAPIFMAASAEGTYNALAGANYIAVPDNSLFVQHGVHTGPALTTAQQDLVVEWLWMEVDEQNLAGSGNGGGGVGGGGGTPTGTTLTQALQEVADCMTIDDWLMYNMDNLCDMQTGNAGPCVSCHNAGDGGFWCSGNAQETLDMSKEFPYIKRYFSGTVNSNGQFETLINANRVIEKGQTECQPNQNCHPVYTLPPGMAQDVADWTDHVLDLWMNGPCTPAP